VDPLPPFAGGWDGTQWSFGTAPYPAGTQSAALNGVDCVGETTCEAVGESIPTIAGTYGVTIEQPLAEGGP